MQRPAIIILTGCSGAGKSTAMAALEDAGFYCVDNMPVGLLPQFMAQPPESRPERPGYAFCMDLRQHRFLEDYAANFSQVVNTGARLTILFLDASQDTLLRRYSQARRHHPLAYRYAELAEAIAAEKILLAPLKAAADHVIDTTTTNVHQLKFAIFGLVQPDAPALETNISIKSFGFKYGVPVDVDLIIDVRFITNPYFVPELRPLDGESAKIRDFVLKKEETRLFLQKYLDLLDYLIPLYEKEGKAYLTVAVGCTGGRHRSVVVAREIYSHIRRSRTQVSLTHRDIGHAS
ncbi:MAG: RNase adapter RapZ [Desulfosarcinaceae bacterium]|nr:RNase adapter RapZ [Desulfosarcinaceae bacterium]